MRIGLVADIHSNFPALSTVLRQLRELGVDQIVCLGDVVGYNAHAIETLHLVAGSCDTVVAGNHDRDTLRADALAGTSSTARAVQQWTHDQLDTTDLRYLEALPNLAVTDEFVAVHGCYLNTDYYRGYATSTMLDANLTAVARRKEWPTLAFSGHTHTTLCGWLANDTVTEVAASGVVSFPDKVDAILINPGAVGQPRDSDQRASFAVVDTGERWVAFHRIRYDIGATVRRIHEAGLPSTLADRLLQGR